MNLKYFSEKNPDIDLNVRRIALARIGVVSPQRVHNICYSDRITRVPSDFLVDLPTTELLTKERTLEKVISSFQPVYFGELFPFYFLETLNLLINLSVFKDVTFKSSIRDISNKALTACLSFHNLGEGSTVELVYATSLVDLKQKEVFIKELWHAKREYHRTASEFFANFPDEEI